MIRMHAIINPACCVCFMSRSTTYDVWVHLRGEAQLCYNLRTIRDSHCQLDLQDPGLGLCMQLAIAFSCHSCNGSPAVTSPVHVRQALATGAQTSTLGTVLACSVSDLSPSSVQLNGSPCSVTMLGARH